MEDSTTYPDSISFFLRDLNFTTASSDTVTNTSYHTSIPQNIAYEWRYILPLYTLVFLLSISGNGMVIATLACNEQMRTVTNVYLLNLAVSDFMLGVFCLPFTLVGQIFRRFLFGEGMCRLVPFIQALSVSVDVWTLVAISVERYFAICQPLTSREWQTLGHVYKMIAILWSVAIALNSPILVVSTLQPMPGNEFKCREAWWSPGLERAFNLWLGFALVLVPIFLMSFAYGLIVTKLHRQMRHEIQLNASTQQLMTRINCCRSNQRLSVESNDSPVPPSPSTPENTRRSKKDLKPKPEEESPHLCSLSGLDHATAVRSSNIRKSIGAKRKVIRMLFVIVLLFFFCWTPLHVVNTIYLFHPQDVLTYIGAKGIMSLQLLAFCSSCSNPIIYCFMNKKFRQAFIALVKGCRCCRCWFATKPERKQVIPQPSSQELTAFVIRSHLDGAEELEGLDVEGCV